MTERPTKPATRGHLWWWLLSVPVLLFGGCVGWSEWYSRNTARSLSGFIEEFSNDKGAVLYCGNGYGKGFANETPWYEWTLVTDNTVEEFAKELGSRLQLEGFQVVTWLAGPEGRTQDQVDEERRDLESRGLATDWTAISGLTQGGLEVEVRVARGELSNSCHARFSDWFAQGDDSRLDVMAVALFHDWAISGTPEQMPSFPPTTATTLPQEITDTTP